MCPAIVATGDLGVVKEALNKIVNAVKSIVAFIICPA
jgi:ethanolamine utilization microcompartment shell protein EutS